MDGRVVVVGLGPAGPDLVTPAARAAIERVPRRFVRTRRHPSAEVVPDDAESFDDVYQRAGDFDEVYETIVERLVGAALDHGEIVYAVPGSPRVLERSVELLVRRSLDHDDLDVEVVPAMSFLDLAWVRLGIDPVEAGVRLVDGHCYEQAAAGEAGPLLVAHCHNRRVLSDIKLAVQDPPVTPVVVLHHLGLADEQIRQVRWDDLDRLVDADHLTSLFVPETGSSAATELRRLDDVVRTLRRECPWDREQTHHSLRRYLLEETYELADAIDAFDESTGDGLDEMEEELGDVLFQVFFHAALATERGEFTTADVARAVREKLVRRHPHVFGDVEVADAAEVYRNWQAIKAGEKTDRVSAMDGIALSSPALLLAGEVLAKAERAGFGAEAIAPAPGGPSPVGPGATSDEVGEVLLGLVRRCQQLGVDPEAALRSAALRVRDRVRALERDGVAGPGDDGAT